MMMINSHTIQIICLILNVANPRNNNNNDSKIMSNTIMYETIFNHPYLKGYLTVLTAYDLLSYDTTYPTFRTTTQKGIIIVLLEICNKTMMIGQSDQKNNSDIT
jgi:hypothetical protein